MSSRTFSRWALVLANGVAVLLVAFAVTKQTRKPEPGRLRQHVDPDLTRLRRETFDPATGGLRQRIEFELAGLRQETYDQAAARMIEDDQQYFGHHTAVAGADTNLERMLAARRAVRIIQEVRALPPSLREAACVALFTRAFDAQTNAFAAIMRHWEDPSSPTNTQSTLSAQLALGAAMFAAAEGGLREALCGEFERLDRFEKQIEERMGNHAASYSALRKSCLRDWFGPDRRLQLNVLRLLALHEGGDILARFDEELRTNQVRTTRKEIPVTAWDAHTTWFEAARLQGAQMDANAAVTRYVCYDWIRDPHGVNKEEQQQLIYRLRSVVFPR